jgi:hypothetical protein
MDKYWDKKYPENFFRLELFFAYHTTADLDAAIPPPRRSPRLAGKQPGDPPPPPPKLPEKHKQS